MRSNRFPGFATLLLRFPLLRVVLLASLWAGHAGAQGTISADCDGDVLALRTPQSFGALLDLSPNRVWERLRLQREGRDFAELGDSVRAVFRVLSREGIDNDARARMERLLDKLQQELIRTDTSASFRLGEGPSSLILDINAGDDDEPWTVGRGADAISVTDTTSESTRRAVCWTALLGRRVAEYGSEPARKNSLETLAARGRRWTNFEDNGYSLTPLELFVNGLCKICRGEMEPPRVQFIVGHILPAFYVQTGSGSRAALVAELGGLLVYNSSRSAYAGASFVFGYPQNGPRQQGVFLHVSRLGQLGVTSAADTTGRQRASVVISTDLYRFIDGLSGSLKRERDAVKRGLSRLMPLN